MGIVAAALSHDHLCLLGKLAGESLRSPVCMVDADLAHHLDDLGVHALGGPVADNA